MLIDWFTVGAQALNFLILVALMKRFLYKPILRAIATREQKIAQELAAAEDKMLEAKTERANFQEKNNEFDRSRAELMKRVTDEAGVERTRIFEEVRNAAESLRVKHQQTLLKESQDIRQAISQRTQKEVFAIARKTLADLAGTNLEDALVEAFIRRLKEMKGPAESVLAKAVSAAVDPVLVRSAMALTQAQQDAIQSTLAASFATDVPARFVVDKNLISGIDLMVNGQKVAWSVDDYLKSVEDGVADLLEDHARGVVRHEQPRPGEAAAKTVDEGR